MADKGDAPREFLEEISKFTLSICKPLYWHDRAKRFPKDVRGASCFILNFGSSFIGVTANHVVEAYRADLERIPTLVCQIGLMPFDLNAAMIDWDTELDIATFAIAECEVKLIGANSVDCSWQWPPPEPAMMQAVSMAGFPEVIREVRADQSAVFNAYGALSAVEAVTDKDIILTFDPQLVAPIGNTELPPLGFNMSGCSGGPVLLHGVRMGVQRWFPVGIIISGPRDFGTGENASFDIVKARRINCLQTNGTIGRSLPSKPTILG